MHTRFIFIISLFLAAPTFAKAEDGKSKEDSASVHVLKRTGSDDWKLIGQAGSFAPAGWEHLNLPALTRVKAVRLGLVVSELVDERFDPVKGKWAAAQYYGESATAPEIPFQYATAGNVLLSDLADLAGVTLRQIENSNPHLRRDVLPKGARLYGLEWKGSSEEWSKLATYQAAYEQKLAAQYSERRTRTISRMPDPNKYESITYTVRMGDFLGRIATKSGASVANIQKWNNLKGSTIYPGQNLVIWVPKGQKNPVQETPTNIQRTPATPQIAQIELSNGEYIEYRVKPGDTLWGIAHRFPGVSAEDIQKWNGKTELIKSGETLKIRKTTISDYSPDKYPAAL